MSHIRHLTVELFPHLHSNLHTPTSSPFEIAACNSQHFQHLEYGFSSGTLSIQRCLQQLNWRSGWRLLSGMFMQVRKSSIQTLCRYLYNSYILTISIIAGGVHSAIWWCNDQCSVKLSDSVCNSPYGVLFVQFSRVVCGTKAKTCTLVCCCANMQFSRHRR